MKKKHFIPRLLIFIVSLILSSQFLYSQEFPIAVGNDTCFGYSLSYDGTNFLGLIIGDNQGSTTITAQLISSSGSLIGNRISFGGSGFPPGGSGGASVSFDGINYLICWITLDSNVKGQLISKTGSLVGSSFTIATSVSTKHGVCSAVYGDTSYLVIYNIGSNNNGIIHGQRVSRSGGLIGSQILISTPYAREISMAYDGTNYLIVWAQTTSGYTINNLYGQFVSKSGAIVGSSFQIASGNFRRDNPTSLTFDGSKYLMTYHQQLPGNSIWNLYAQFITTSGSLGNLITICDSTNFPAFPAVAFGNNSYFITWTQGFGQTATIPRLMGRFYNINGIPNDTASTVFNGVNKSIPFGGCIYGSNKFFSIATRLDTNFTNGDVYGKFIMDPNNIENLSKDNDINIFPNPANDKIYFFIDQKQYKTITIYNIQGQKELIKTITNDLQFIDISMLKNGMYFICYENDKKIMIKKFIKN